MTEGRTVVLIITLILFVISVAVSFYLYWKRDKERAEFIKFLTVAEIVFDKLQDDGINVPEIWDDTVSELNKSRKEGGD